VEKLRRSVEEILDQPENDETSAEYIKKTRGCQPYLRRLASEETVRYPSYWKCVLKGSADRKTTVKRKLIEPQSSAFREIENLVQKTWEANNVGHGRDAVGLSHSGIVVKKIWWIENPTLFRKYDAKKKEICSLAAECRSVKGLPGESPVLTRHHGT